MLCGVKGVGGGRHTVDTGGQLEATTPSRREKVAKGDHLCQLWKPLSRAPGRAGHLRCMSEPVWVWAWAVTKGRERGCHPALGSTVLQDPAAPWRGRGCQDPGKQGCGSGPGALQDDMQGGSHLHRGAAPRPRVALQGFPSHPPSEVGPHSPTKRVPASAGRPRRAQAPPAEADLCVRSGRTGGTDGPWAESLPATLASTRAGGTL